MKIVLLLHNIRSVYNVGAILRTAEGLGIAEVAYSGYTPRCNDAKLLPHLRAKLNHQLAKSALGAEEFVSQINLDSPIDWLEQQRKAGYKILGLENNLPPSDVPRRLILGQPAELETTNLESSNLKPADLESNDLKPAELSSRIVLILGEEVQGIPAELRQQVDFFLEIPMQGRKESFNVSVATGIALWGLLNCYQA